MLRTPRLLAAGLLSLWLLLVSGCSSIPETHDLVNNLTPPSRRQPEVSAATGKLLTKDVVLAQVPHAYLGDPAYAEVNSGWLPVFYEKYREELFRSGIMHWDARFTCKHFAGYYAAMAQADYYYATFHTYTAANSLAIGTFWYIRADGRGHAIIVALTERGRLFIEPQTGKEVALTPTELSHSFLKIF